MKEVDILVSVHPFESEINEWIKVINSVVKNEKKLDKKKFKSRFDKVDIALSLFSSISELLPNNQTKWYHNEDEKLITIPGCIQLIMEFITQSLYLEASHLWPASNHSARCALEHTFWTIRQIGNPKESKTKIGGPGQSRFSDMINDVFDIPRFDKSKVKILFKKSGNEINLYNKVGEVYKHLSYYVHTSNIHIELKGARPHITHDLEMNPKAEKETTTNFNETFNLIIVLLSITCSETLEKQDIKSLKKILPATIFNQLKNVISN